MDLGAGAIVLGPETRHATTSGVNAYIATHAPSHVIILNPDAGVLGRSSADALGSERPAVVPTAVHRPMAGAS
jgi:hypothetical protein